MFLRRGVCDLSWAVLLALRANGLPCGGEWHFLLAVARSRGGGIERIRFSAHPTAKKYPTKRHSLTTKVMKRPGSRKLRQEDNARTPAQKKMIPPATHCCTMPKKTKRVSSDHVTVLAQPRVGLGRLAFFPFRLPIDPWDDRWILTMMRGAEWSGSELSSPRSSDSPPHRAAKIAAVASPVRVGVGRVGSTLVCGSCNSPARERSVIVGSMLLDTCDEECRDRIAVVGQGPWRPGGDHVCGGLSCVDVLELGDELSTYVLDGVLSELLHVGGSWKLHSFVVTPGHQSRNCHIRDRYIRFEEDGHRYLLHPGTPMETVFPISVSGLWSLYFKKFNPGEVIQRRFLQWSQDATSVYYAVICAGFAAGQTQEDISKRIELGWSHVGKLGSALGTRMHRCIELALGGGSYDGSSKEMGMFHRFVREWLEPYGWRVYRLEWSIYCSDAMVAGQVDAVFEAADGLHMVDWKRCAKPLDENFGRGEWWGVHGRPPFHDMLDNSCNHYFVQQNLYAVILERRYGIKLRSMWLLQLHPNQDTFRMIAVPDLRGRAAWILDAYTSSRRVDSACTSGGLPCRA